MRLRIKQALVALVGTAVLLFAVTPARAGLITPSIAQLEPAGVTVSVNGQSLGFFEGRVTEGGQFIIPHIDIRNEQFGVIVDAAGDMEPFIGYGVTAFNFTPAPLAFLFAFGSPYAGGPYDTLSSSHSSSVTDSGGAPNGTVTVTPTGASIHMPNIDFAPVAAANLGVGCVAAVGAGGSGPCDMGGLVSVPVVTLPAGFFGVDVGLNLSGNDIWTGNGRVELLNGPDVPEPLSLGLLGLGLAAVVFFRRRLA